MFLRSLNISCSVYIMTTNKTTRTIFAVERHREQADSTVAYLKMQGRHPKMVSRTVSALGISIPVFVVLCDAYQAPTSVAHGLADVDRCSSTIPGALPGSSYRCERIGGHLGHCRAGRVYFVKGSSIATEAR